MRLQGVALLRKEMFGDMFTFCVAKRYVSPLLSIGTPVDVSRVLHEVHATPGHPTADDLTENEKGVIARTSRSDGRTAASKTQARAHEVRST